jgi:ABC-type glycerol-3-phosphate transport system substrate-binding protein
MTQACDAIHKIGKDCISIIGKSFGLPIMIGDMALRVASKDQMLDLSTGKAKWTDPEFKQLLTLIDYIGKHGWYQKGWPAASENMTPFQGGKVAFVAGFLGGDGGGASWSNLSSTLGSDKFGVVQMPKLAPGDVPGVTPGPLNDSAGVTEGQAIAIPSWSKHPKEAELLLRTTLDPEVQKEMANQPLAAILPSLKQAKADWVPNPVFAKVLDIASQSKSADLLTYMGYGYLPTVIAQLQELSQGKTSVDAAAAALQKAADTARSK